jgi:hypothetical protein
MFKRQSWYSLLNTNTFSEIPPATSLNLATRVRTWRVGPAVQ